MNTRLTKLIQITTPTLPVAYSYKVQDGFRKMDVDIGLCYDGANAINTVIGLRIYLFDGQSLGVDDGLVANYTGHVPKKADFSMYGIQQKIIDFAGPMNFLFEFFKVPAFNLTGSAVIEVSLNTY